MWRSVWCVCVFVSARNGISLESDWDFVDNQPGTIYNIKIYRDEIAFDIYLCCSIFSPFSFPLSTSTYRSVSYRILICCWLFFRQWYLCTPFFIISSIFAPNAANICCCFILRSLSTHVRFNSSVSFHIFTISKALGRNFVSNQCSVLRELNTCATKLKFVSIGISFIVYFSLFNFIMFIHAIHWIHLEKRTNTMNIPIGNWSTQFSRNSDARCCIQTISSFFFFKNNNICILCACIALQCATSKLKKEVILECRYSQTHINSHLFYTWVVNSVCFHVSIFWIRRT